MSVPAAAAAAGGYAPRRGLATGRRVAVRSGGGRAPTLAHLVLDQAALMHLSTQLVGDGRPQVIYLHGLFGRGKNLATIARALAAEGHAGVLVDLPDHGRSGWSQRFDYQELATIVAAELRAKLGSAPRMDVVGHSLGGKVAMLMALQHPDVVRRLAVVDIMPAHSPRVVDNVELVAAMRGLDLHSLSSRAEADTLLSAAVPDLSVRQFLLQNLKQRRDADAPWFWELNLDLLGDSLEQIAGWPEVGGTFEGPTLWIAGARSPYIKPEHEAGMRRLFPHVRSVVVPDAGHWVHADNPAYLIRTLSEFLA